MKKNHSSLKKVILTVSMLAVFLIATIVSVVVVLAAQRGEVSTSIDIEYVVDGVTAKISANYATVPNDKEKEIVVKSMTTSSSETEVIFEPSQAETSAQLLPEDEIILNTKNQTIVFEYVFENLGDSAFSLQLVESPETENINQTYFVTATRLETNEYRSKISNETLGTQAVTEYGQVVYVYVKASIANERNMASYDGTFAWAMLNQDYVTVNLNNGALSGGSSTLKVIPISEVANIMMPVMSSLPTVSDMANVFDGYYQSENGSGTKFINGDGTSASVADVYAGQTLYACEFKAFEISDTTLSALTDAGKTLETVTVPSGITEIANAAFDGSNASIIYIPASVTTIGESAFEGNTSLKQVIYLESDTAAYADEVSQLQTIGARAFYGCTSLEEITIPENVTAIGYYAFYNTTAVTKINYRATVCDVVSSDDEFNYIFYQTGNSGDGITVNISVNVTKIPMKLFQPYNSVDTSPKIVKVLFEEGSVCSSIGANAFAYCNELAEITIPENVTTIGEHSFNSCKSLESVTIPSKITTIGASAFAYCANITEVHISSIEDWGSIVFKNTYSNPIAARYLHGGGVRPDLYISGELTTTFEMPSTITEIKDYAFYAMKLGDFVIPEGVTKIGTGAFRFSLLTSLSIPSTVAEIAEGNPFVANPHLETIVVAEGNTVYNSGNGSNCIIETATNTLIVGGYGTTIPEGVIAIGENAFNQSTRITSMTLPSTLERIGQKAFWYTYISKLTIPASVKIIEPYIIDHGSVAFENTSGWFVADSADATEGTEITISDTDFAANATLLKTTYADKYFIKKETTPLSYFTLSDDGTTITGLSDEGKAVENLELIIPSGGGITTIGESAFASQTNIISVEISEGITTIGERAFSDCTAITSITIPESVTTINNKAFYNTTAVSTIYFNAIECAFSVGNMIFYNLGTASDGVSCIVGQSVTKIPSYMFHNGTFTICTNLINVDFSNANSLVSIGVRAFHGTNITSLYIPASVTSIKSCAFYGCTNLTEVTFENTEGWFVSTSSTATSGTNVTLSTTDLAANATLLTSTYYVPNWKRS